MKFRVNYAEKMLRPKLWIEIFCLNFGYCLFQCHLKIFYRNRPVGLLLVQLLWRKNCKIWEKCHHYKSFPCNRSSGELLAVMFTSLKLFVEWGHSVDTDLTLFVNSAHLFHQPKAKNASWGGRMQLWTAKQTLFVHLGRP